MTLDNVELWFQDEARIGQQNTITRLWAPCGTRPRAIRQGAFLFTYFFAAVCPMAQKHAAVILPNVGSTALEIHLAEISKQIAPGKYAVVIMDRAGWHRSKKIKIPSNISILLLPPYSPELNPVEQIWSYLRQRELANRAFHGYEGIVKACCKAWNFFIAQPNIISSLCSRSWAIC